MQAAGWYPDPSGGGFRRYWDGENWGPLEPPPPPPPQAHPKPSSRNKGLWIVLGVLGAAIATLVLTVGLGKHKQPALEEVKTANGLSGSPEKWRDAVCMPGSFKNKSEHILRDATSEGSCESLVTGSPITIMTFDSDEAMIRELRWLRMKYFVYTENGSKRLVYAPDAVTITEEPIPYAGQLEPLKQYGFEINTVPYN